MNSTFALAFLVGICAWSTSGRSAIIEQTVNAREPRECIDLAKIAANTIKTKYELPNISVEISVRDVCDQIQNLDSKIDLVSAVTLAVESLLTDFTDAESPLALAIDLAFADLDINYISPVPDHVVKHAQKILFDHLNTKTTSVKLLSRTEAPEGGESVDSNWILLLTAKKFSDHSFWAIVDRKDEISVYNYGFN